MPSGSIGPALPPDLIEARRKRKETALASQSTSSSVPSPAATESDNVKAHAHFRDPRSAVAPSDYPKDESGEAEEEESDEEDIGPQLPGQETRSAPASVHHKHDAPIKDEPTGQVNRPEWMLAPPKSSDWTHNIDTTKLKSRAFNTSKSRPESSDGPGSKWTSVPGQTDATDTLKEAEKARKSVASGERQKAQVHEDRGPSLFDQHASKRRRTGDDARDDVSRRPFDREKDIAATASLTKTKQFADRAKDMKSMFDSGSYL